MRVDVEKWIFVGIESQKAFFFEEAQKIGAIEFTSANSPKIHFQNELINKIQEALKILRDVESGYKKSSLSPEAAVDHLIELRKLRESHLLAIKELESQRRRLDPYGIFSKKQIDSLSQAFGFEVKLVLFPVNCEKYDQLVVLEKDGPVGYGIWTSADSIPSEIQVIQCEKGTREIEQEIVLEKEALEKIRNELSEIKQLESEIKNLLFDRMDKIHLDWSYERSSHILENRLFYVEGWVPVDCLEEVNKLLAKTQVLANPVKIQEDETVPTYLKNNAFGQIGQDLVAVYDTPASTDKDPSSWVLGFFILFFSMIIGDGGYGLIFLAISLLIHFKCPDLKGVALRMKHLGMLLSLGCVFWGFVTCSFFALPVSPSNPLREYSLMHRISLEQIRYHAALKDETYQEWLSQVPRLASVDSSDPQKIAEEGYKGELSNPDYIVLRKVNDSVLKEFALFIGIIHLTVSLARYATRTWSSFGWILFLVGSWLYFPSVVNAETFVNYLFWIDPSVTTEFGLNLVYLSLAISFGLSLIQNKFYGVLEIMNLLQIFSDALSYLRLYALGLAGAVMSETFNELAHSSGFVLGFFLLLAGHSVNLVLAIMGGVIHGLRLNFLEWYHYSFSGAGRWLRPLKKIKESSH